MESDKNGLEEDDNEEKAAAIPLVKVDTAKNQMMITNNLCVKNLFQVKKIRKDSPY